MRRVMNPVVRHVASRVRSVGAGWDDFWYTPADPTLLGVIRILTGLMLVYTHAVWGVALNDFFGPDPWLSKGLVRSMLADQFVFSFWSLVPENAAAMWAVWAASMAVLTLF